MKGIMNPQVSNDKHKTQINMKNNIIIRLENNLFATSHISRHLPVAKDKERYLSSALPKCKLKTAFKELPAFLASLKKMGRPTSVGIITAFRGEPLWKLLSANGFAGARVFQSAEKALSESGSSTVLFSSNPQDLLAADMAGVPSTGDLTTSESVLSALGVRKHAFKMEHRAA